MATLAFSSAVLIRSSASSLSFARADAADLDVRYTATAAIIASTATIQPITARGSDIKHLPILFLRYVVGRSGISFFRKDYSAPSGFACAGPQMLNLNG